MLKINEIFYSIQGESSYAGWPTVFIRTSGCPLRCTYCDTTYAYYDGQMQHRAEIIRQVQSFNPRFVCLTGGEPLAQKETLFLLTELCDLGFEVSLETSGAIDCTPVDPRVKKIIDIKTPSSGEQTKFSSANLRFAQDGSTEFKFVIGNDEDFNWSEEFATQHQLFKNYQALYSPTFGENSPRWLAEKILSARSRARLQLQLHKYIWSPEQRGV